MKIVIIGGDAAGMSAAMEVYRNSENTHITILEKGSIYSYGQCGLPYVIDGRVHEPEGVVARSVEDFRTKYGMDARVHHEVQHIDSRLKIVTGIHTKTGEQFEIPYDKCLIASGASSIVPPLQHVHLKGIHTIKTIPQMHALLADLQYAKKAVVIGAGFIGLEAAEALKLRGLDVTILQRSAQVMKGLVEEFSHRLIEEASQHHVPIVLNAHVSGFLGENRVTHVVTSEATYEADVVIIATGVLPNTNMIEADKLPNGALIVNERMETSVANVYAAGDCAAHYHRITGEMSYVALGTTANKQGRIAGRQMAGLSNTFKGIVGTTIFQFFNLTVGMTGIQTQYAYPYRANHIASYYPTPKLIDFIVYTDEQGVLKGLQAIGEAGVDKRIDVFATALYNEMTLAQLVDLDLSYAPPYNGVWDALLQVSKRYT